MRIRPKLCCVKKQTYPRLLGHVVLLRWSQEPWLWNKHTACEQSVKTSETNIQLVNSLWKPVKQTHSLLTVCENQWNKHTACEESVKTSETNTQLVKSLWKLVKQTHSLWRVCENQCGVIIPNCSCVMQSASSDWTATPHTLHSYLPKIKYWEEQKLHFLLY